MYVYFSIKDLYKKDIAMHHRMRKPSKSILRRCAVRMVEINKYLAIFTGSNASEKTRDTELNKIPLHIFTNSLIRQEYMQSFYFEADNFKEAINMSECMKIAESIYEGVVEPSCNKKY